MTRRECMRLIGFLGIKPMEPCTAELGDWCIWSRFERNIGRRLTNNHDYIYDDDLYIKLKDKLKIEKEYEKVKKAVKKAEEEHRRISIRGVRATVVLSEHIEFV